MGIKAPTEYKVVFLCGSAAVSWVDINYTMMVADHLQSTPTLNAGFIRVSQPNCREVSKFQFLRLQGQQTSFLDMLQTFRLTECQNPRDKVFAPLGLASASAMHRISVDYEQSISDVYLNVVKYLMSEPGHELDFLAYTVKPTEPVATSPPNRDSGNLPSWVPNWDIAVDVQPLAKSLMGAREDNARAMRPFDRRNIPLRNEGPRVNCYHGCGSARLGAVIIDTALSLEGVYCDTIAEIMPLGDVAKCREIGAKWGRQSKGQYPPTRESFEIAMRRTNSADVQYDTLGRVRSRGGCIDHTFLRKQRAELTVLEHERQENMQRALKKATNMRNLCLTKKGYIGLIPVSAVVNDQIYVLLGGQVLYVLRTYNRDDWNHTYIGECYIHGLMDGEVMQWVNNGAANVDDLLLV